LTKPRCKSRSERIAAIIFWIALAFVLGGFALSIYCAYALDEDERIHYADTVFGDHDD